MESVIRMVVVYIFLLIVMRISGKRTMAESTAFDMVVLLIIGDLVQEAVMDNDYSITNCVIVISTLMGLEVTLSFLKLKSKKVDKVLDGVPLVIVENGKLLKERADKARVKEDEVMESARSLHGLERMDQIKYAVLEKGGEISIIKKETE